MTMYAANAGKSGGEFFTPQEVSELLARITLVGKTEINKVYDPACGSGSLLLKFAKVLGKDNVRNGFYGQEINLTTYNLCRINMFLHDINYEKFDIAHGDTLIKPSSFHIDNRPFDAIVSNPPYSTRWEGDSNPLLINDERFTPAGVLAPRSKADLAFVMHILAWLDPNGTAAIVSFPGAMYRSGKEQKIRKYLVDNNYIDAIIQLPTDLFYGTSIGTCIVVVKKHKNNNSIQFIDATNLFTRENARNKLTRHHIELILDSIETKKSSNNFSRLVCLQEIRDKEYNLSVTTYITESTTSKAVDIISVERKLEQSVKNQRLLRRKIKSVIDELL